MKIATENNVDAKVAQGFGDEWSKFRQDETNLAHDERETIFANYFRIFSWDLLPPGGGTGAEAVPNLRIPNPYHAGDEIILQLEAPGTGGAGVAVLYGVAGARVRTLPFDASGGVAVLVWDGRTDGGVRAGAGVYFLTTATGHGRVTRRLVLMP